VFNKRQCAAENTRARLCNETGGIMSERARQFVEAWIRQFVRPEREEHPLNLFESRADAIACVYSALEDGISRLEIREEYADLVRHISAARYRLASLNEPEKEKRPAHDVVTGGEPPSSGRLNLGRD
jgi:hypothetical protein